MTSLCPNDVTNGVIEMTSLTVFLLSCSTFLIGIWKVELRHTMEARIARLWVTRESLSRYVCLRLNSRESMSDALILRINCSV